MSQGCRPSAPRHAAVYQITVDGQLDSSWSTWLHSMDICCETQRDGRPVTTLTGELPDQSALRGLLAKLWNLNLALISVNRKEPTCESERKAKDGNHVHAPSG